jgi:hypothetical protein
MHTNDRFEHLVHILKTEITSEHKREAQLLMEEDPKQSKVCIHSCTYTHIFIHIYTYICMCIIGISIIYCLFACLKNSLGTADDCMAREARECGSHHADT